MHFIHRRWYIYTSFYYFLDKILLQVQAVMVKIVPSLILQTLSRDGWPKGIIEYLFHRCERICSNCCIFNPVFFPPNMIYRITRITEFVLRWATRRMQHVDQDLITFPEHQRSPAFFRRVHVLLLVFVCLLCFVNLCGFFCQFHSEFVIFLLSFNTPYDYLSC